MACDRFVVFEKGHRPSREAVQMVIEDYFGGAAKQVDFEHSRFTVLLEGVPTHPLKRVVGGRLTEMDVEERYIEVFMGDDNIDVITRRQDEYTNTLAFGLARLLARWGYGEYEAEGEVPTKHQSWFRPFLWKIWRSGGLTSDSFEFQQLVKMFGLSKTELQTIILAGLLSTDGHLYTITDAGLGMLGSEETPLWRKRLQKVKYAEPHAKAALAASLRASGLTLEEISEKMNISRSHVGSLLEIHENASRRRNERDQAVRAFQEGSLPFERLPVEVLGDFSVSVLNVFDRMGVKTVAQLLGTTVRTLKRQKNLGSKHVATILAMLKACDEALSPV